jgi:hypothetical protein
VVELAAAVSDAVAPEQRADVAGAAALAHGAARAAAGLVDVNLALARDDGRRGEVEGHLRRSAAAARRVAAA